MIYEGHAPGTCGRQQCCKAGALLECTAKVTPATDPQTGANAPQRVIKARRDYNSWVARETIEDYALRFTPRSFRKWSEWRVANTAFGAASFLILEAVGVIDIFKKFP